MHTHTHAHPHPHAHAHAHPQVTSGHYYGSDGLRSPLTMTRDPGMPEYEGEPDPQEQKYNR